MVAAASGDDDFDGILIFIKPSLIGQEPRDVINYWQGRSTFPQEVITDQWFSEAQFESYRALGRTSLTRSVAARGTELTWPPLLRRYATIIY